MITRASLSTLALLMAFFSANNAWAQQYSLDDAMRFAAGANAPTAQPQPAASFGLLQVAGKWYGGCGELQVTQSNDYVVLDSGSTVYTGRLFGDTIRGTWVSREYAMSGSFELRYEPVKDRLQGWYSTDLNNGTRYYNDKRDFYADRVK